MSAQKNEFCRAFNLTCNKLYGFVKGSLVSETDTVEIIKKTYTEVFSQDTQIPDFLIDEVMLSKAAKLCFEKIGYPQNIEQSSAINDIQNFLNACEVFDADISENTLNETNILVEPVQNLNPIHRTFIYLRLYYKKSISEIAALAMCSEETAKTVMYDAYSAVMPNIASVCRSTQALQGYPILQLLNAAMQKQNDNASYADSDNMLKDICNSIFSAEQEQFIEETAENVPDLKAEDPPVQPETDTFENTISEENEPASVYDPEQSPVNPEYTSPIATNPVWERVCASFAYACIPETKSKLAEAFGLITASPYEARMMFQFVAENFPNEAFAYLGLLMLDVGASDISHFYNIPADYRSFPSYMNAYHFGDASLKAFLEQIASIANGHNPYCNPTPETKDKKGTALKVWGIIAAAAQALAIAFFAYGLTRIL